MGSKFLLKMDGSADCEPHCSLNCVSRFVDETLEAHSLLKEGCCFVKTILTKSIFTVTLSLESRRMQNPCQFLTLDNEEVFNILIHVYS